jgi:hypothetical protein
MGLPPGMAYCRLRIRGERTTQCFAALSFIHLIRVIPNAPEWHHLTREATPGRRLGHFQIDANVM